MLRWGWLFLERTRILSGIQFTTYFIEIFVVETKRFVSSFVNVILTRQACGQRSSRAAESKRRAIGNYFSERICFSPPTPPCWVFLERTQILSGIQFTTHFIEFFVVHTKRFVSIFVNLILTRQTCGQRSSKAAESKRRALGNYFCE